MGVFLHTNLSTFVEAVRLTLKIATFWICFTFLLVTSPIASAISMTLYLRRALLSGSFLKGGGIILIFMINSEILKYKSSCTHKKISRLQKNNSQMGGLPLSFESLSSYMNPFQTRFHDFPGAGRSCTRNQLLVRPENQRRVNLQVGMISNAFSCMIFS